MWQYFDGHHDKGGGGLFSKAIRAPLSRSETGLDHQADAALTAMQDASRLDASPNPHWIQWISRSVRELFDAMVGFSDEYLFAMHGGLIRTSDQHAHDE